MHRQIKDVSLEKKTKSKHKKTNFFVRGGQRDRSVGGFYIAAIAEDIQIEVIANEIIADKHFYPLRKKKKKRFVL